MSARYKTSVLLEFNLMVMFDKVEEEVTSPNRGARIQETMLPGLEVTVVSFVCI